jgi:hypothetical protein
MKKAYVFLLVLLIWFRAGYAQEAAFGIESFRSTVLPDFSAFFASADLTFKGQLKLSALPEYALLPAAEKQAVMDQLISTWQKSLVLVQYESQRELWGWNSESLKSLLLDTWDINTASLAIPPADSGSGTNSHPWFCYVGGMFNLDSFNNITSTFTTSLGFFLLKNRWDLAATFSSSITGNTDAYAEDITRQFSAGLQSKVYFPFKQYNISPSIGAEVALTSVTTDETSTTTFTPAALLGISWFVGSGSLDFGVKIKKHPMVMIGYTFRPKFKK